MKPVCLVIGAGAGIGGSVGKRFAAGGYHAVLCRRSDEEGLNSLVEEIEKAGGAATGLMLNAAEEGRPRPSRPSSRVVQTQRREGFKTPAPRSRSARTPDGGDGLERPRGYWIPGDVP